MLIECEACPVREVHCADCAVRVLLELEAPGPGLDARERRVLEGWVALGLVSPQDAAQAHVQDDRVRARSVG